MKRIVKSSFLILALLSLVFSSCKKEYDRPEFDPLPIGEVLTIEKILNMESGTVFSEDASVYGIITADEKSGNLYKAAFLQDRASGKAIELYLNATSGVRIGDSVRVYLKGVTYAMYNGLPQLSNFEPDGHIVILANDKPIQPLETTIASVVAGNHLGGLIKLNNVMFTDRGTFADPTTYGNRTLVDPSNLSQSVIVRTSNYANFANDSLPQGVGNLVAIASVYNTTWQLLIRSVSELEFENYDPGVDDGVMPLPYYQSFASNFGTYTTYDVNGAQSWEIDYSTAKMAGFANSVNYANEDWLISSPFSLKDVNSASLTMTYIARYFNNLNDDITIQISSDYQTGDPNDATWTRVPATWTAGSDWNTFAQTTVDLSDFTGENGEKLRVAVKYLSTSEKAGTIEVQSIAIQEGNSPTPPGPNPGGEVQNMPYSQSFASDFGTYMTYDVLGPQSWIIDYHTAKMTGHEGGNPGTDYANEDWLISSPVAITGVNSARLTMSYIGRYFTSINQEITLWASEDYVYGNDPATAQWIQLPISLKEGTNWNDFLTAEVDLSQFIGQTMTFAVVYTSSDQDAGTIEIQNITIEEGNGPTPPPGPTPTVQTLPYEQIFTTEFGTYSTFDVLGSQSWMIDYSTAKMTGYVNSVNYANEDWLISAPVSLEGVQAASFTMTYIARYFSNLDEDITVQVSSDYESGNPNTATWKRVFATWTSGNDWTTFAETTVDLSEFVGQQVRVAVKYLSTSTKAGTIEVKSIVIKEGAGPTPPPPGPGGDVQSMPYVQSFETEFGTYITKDVEGAQSWEIDFKSAKMSGYSGAAYANEDWLISSPVQIVGVEHAKVIVNYAAKYSGPSDNDITIQVSSGYEYNAAPSTADWVELPVTFTNNNKDWNFNDLEASLDNFLGQTVTVAIKYTSTTTAARTIEIKMITVQEGDAGGPTPPPPGPGEPEGSGTQDDPYNVAAGIANQNTDHQNHPENTITAWVQGYIVGTVVNGTSSVNGNGDVNWSGPFDSATNVVIADDPDCHEITQCVFVNLPSGKPLRTDVNLKDHPENLGKKLAVLGNLRSYFGQAGLRDSNGQNEDFILEGSTPPTPPSVVYLNETLLTEGSFAAFLTYSCVGDQGWYWNENYGAVMSGFDNNVSYANEDWLISPELDLSNSIDPVLVFDHARGPESSMNVGVEEGYYTVWVIGDYGPGNDPIQYPKLEITGVNHPTVKWQYVSSGELSIPLNLRDSHVRIAFKYISADGASATWEIKNVIVKERR